jgi:hypothetical protein
MTSLICLSVINCLSASVCNCLSGICRVERVHLPDGSEQLIGCGEQCLNRLSFIHCDPRTCPCGTSCSNKPFHQLKAPSLDVFLTENRGHGVRVAAPLPKGCFVVEYAGEVGAREDRGGAQRVHARGPARGAMGVSDRGKEQCRESV